MEIYATLMTSLGDVLIIASFICALIVFVLNFSNSISKNERRIPVQYLILGWTTFIIGYVGLVSISRTNASGVEVGFITGMPLVVAVLIQYFSFALLLLGTAWTLRNRRLGKEERQERQNESIGQSVTA